MKEPDLTPSLKMGVTAMEVVEPEQRLCSGSHCSATMHLAKQATAVTKIQIWLAMLLIMRIVVPITRRLHSLPMAFETSSFVLKDREGIYIGIRHQVVLQE